MKYILIGAEVIGAVVMLLLLSIFLTYAWPESKYGLSAWVQAVGSIAAIFVAIGIMSKQRSDAQEAGDKAAREEHTAILQAIDAEIFSFRTALVNIYEAFDSNWTFEMTNEFWNAYPTSTPRFYVFERCSQHIGRVSDPNLRRYIVASYAELHTFFEALNANSALVNMREGSSRDEQVRRDEMQRLGPVLHSQLERLVRLIDEVHVKLTTTS